MLFFYKRLVLLILTLMAPNLSKQIGLSKNIAWELTTDRNCIHLQLPDKSITFSQSQVIDIVRSMNSDMQAYFMDSRCNWSKFAEYVIDNDITPASILSSQSPRHASQIMPHRIEIGIKINHTPNNNDAHMVTTYSSPTYNMSTLKTMKDKRDIQGLKDIQKSLEKDVNSSRLAKQYLGAHLEFVDKALIDLNCITDSTLQGYRNLQMHGNKRELQVALQSVDSCLNSWLSCWWYGDRVLKNQQYYLNMLLQDQLTDPLYAIHQAPLDVAQQAYESLRKNWHNKSKTEQEQEIQKRGYNPLEMAKAIVTSRADYHKATMRRNIDKKVHEFRQDYYRKQLEKQRKTENKSSYKDPLVVPLHDGLELVSTSARNYTYNISPEKDAYLNNLLDRIRSDSKDFDQYLEWSALALEVNNKSGMLTSEQSVSVIDHAMYAAHLVKIAGAECLSRFDPTLQIADYATLIKELGLLTIDMGLGAAHVLQFGDLVNKDVQTERHGMVNTRELMPQRLRNRIEMFEALWHTMPDIMNQLAQIPAEDQARIIGRVIGDIAFAKGMAKTISLMRSGEIVALLQEGGELATNFKNTVKNGIKNIGKNPRVATPEGITVKADQAGQTSSWFQNTTDKVVGGAQKMMSAERALLEKVAQDILGGLEKELPRIKELFDFKRKGFAEFANKWIKIDYKHILGFELQFSRRGIPDIGGLHHDFMNCLEKSGALEFANKVMHKGGFYKVEARYLGNKVKDITFFPAHWSRKQVVKSIYEAYDNFIKSGATAAIGKGGKYVVEAKTKDGIDIIMFITKKGLITTAYPTIK